MELRLNASADWSATPSPIGEITTWLQAELQCYPDAATRCQLTVSLLEIEPSANPHPSRNLGALRRLSKEVDPDQAGGGAVGAASARAAGGAPRRRLAVSGARLRVLVVRDAYPYPYPSPSP